jgi:hypothetical protein
MTVSGVQAAGVAWAVLAGRCLAVIPNLPCLIFGPCRRMALPLICSRVAAFLVDAMAALPRKSAPASWAAITFPFSRPTWPSERGRPQPE